MIATELLPLRDDVHDPPHPAADLPAHSLPPSSNVPCHSSAPHSTSIKNYCHQLHFVISLDGSHHPLAFTSSSHWSDPLSAAKSWPQLLQHSIFYCWLVSISSARWFDYRLLRCGQSLMLAVRRCFEWVRRSGCRGRWVATGWHFLFLAGGGRCHCLGGEIGWIGVVKLIIHLETSDPLTLVSFVLRSIIWNLKLKLLFLNFCNRYLQIGKIGIPCVSSLCCGNTCLILVDNGLEIDAPCRSLCDRGSLVRTAVAVHLRHGLERRADIVAVSCLRLLVLLLLQHRRWGPLQRGSARLGSHCIGTT